MSKKRKWYQFILDWLDWSPVSPAPKPIPIPQPDPVKPPTQPVRMAFPESIAFRRMHTTRDKEYNIAWHGNGIVSEYKNSNPRNRCRLVPLGSNKDSLAGEAETWQAPSLGFCAAENGRRGAPRLVNGKWEHGRKPRHEISICTAVYQGRAVVFSSEFAGGPSQMEDAETGALLLTLPRDGAVIAAAPYGDRLLMALDGSAGMTVVDTMGHEYQARVRCFARRNDRIMAGGQDGNIYEFVSGAWDAGHITLSGRIMDMAYDTIGRLWATTDKGDLYCSLSDGAVRRFYRGEVDYGSGSWFGAKLGWHHSKLALSHKMREGSSWRCVVDEIVMTEDLGDLD